MNDNIYNVYTCLPWYLRLFYIKLSLQPPEDGWLMVNHLRRMVKCRDSLIAPSLKQVGSTAGENCGSKPYTGVYVKHLYGK